jgi:uracil-DNA glycosylase
MNLFKNAHKSWVPLLYSLAYKEPLLTFLENLSEISFQPDVEEIFKVFEMPVEDIKVVIIGQEPYPIPGTANGLAFAVKENSKPTNILKSIRHELLKSKELTSMQDWKTLEHLTDQGVFLLNGSLTSETGSQGSHAAYWKDFTDAVISFISVEKPCIWMLWGRVIKTRIKIINPLLVEGYDKDTIEEIPIDPTLNYIVPGAHPVTGEGFSGNGFFYVNRILDKKSLTQIIW